MNRLKVGDRVKVKDGYYQGHPTTSRYNLPRGVGVIKDWYSDQSITVRYGDIVSPPVNGWSFDLVDEGPVRTVTRREIVPGCYGRVSVQGDMDGYVSVCLTGPRGGNHKEDHARSLSASDLRSAAMIFSQLAEALDENADNA